MTQSVVTKETKDILVAKLEGILERKLKPMEETIAEYVVEQIRLGLVEYGVK
jgi:hypothetical protein